MKLSVIVPLLNEARELPGLLERLSPLIRNGSEVIVVDGGSDDGSAQIAERAGFTVVRASRGRARQMNAGASQASGDVLLFLHADTQLPDAAETAIAHGLADSGRVWGRFDVRITGRSPMLRVVGCLMNVRSRLTGIATGDQAMFVTRPAFDAVGGFPDQPLMEDIELSLRLRKGSAPACLRQQVTTSDRRWERDGVWRTIALMWRLRWLYWTGTPPERLAKLYE